MEDFTVPPLPTHDNIELWGEHLERLRNHLIAAQPALAPWFVPLKMSGTSAVTIPFLSIRTFKHSTVFARAPSEPVTHFFSSGSTNVLRGKNTMSATGLEAYGRSCVQGFSEFLQRHSVQPSTRILSLVPSPTQWADSSLSAMLGFVKDAGYDLHWTMPSEISEAVRMSLSSTDTVLVFGTSFHHMQVAEILEFQQGDGALLLTTPPILNQRNKKLLVVDTGGTKGKTLVLERPEMATLLHKTYASIAGNSAEITVASQYGMCELASQAWSGPGAGAGSFYAAKSLAPVAVDPRTFSFAPHHSPAVSGNSQTFLGFIDRSNVDSYPAILTEDLGEILADESMAAHSLARVTTPLTLNFGGLFRLHGRGPMASIKGCSLRAAGVISSKKFKFKEADTENQPQFGFSGHSPGQKCNAPAALFSQRELLLLEKAWSSWQVWARGQSLELPQENKKIALIASANVPVTFLYPLLAAHASGYGQALVCLPSLRDDDPLSGRTLGQIKWLLGRIGVEVGQSGMKIEQVDLTDIARSAPFETAVVFGTDATLKLFEDWMQELSIGIERFLGFGSVENFIRAPDRALRGDPAALAELAQACLAWKGRGCLTPCAVVLPAAQGVNKGTIQTETEVFGRRFALHYSSLFADEFGQLGIDLSAFHWHDTIDLKARLSDLTPEQFFCFPGCTVVDCTRTPLLCFNQDQMDFSLAGQGLISLLREDQLAGNKPVSFYPVNPEFSDPHMGKNWMEWLNMSPLRG